MEIRGIFFDLGGTLFHYEGAQQRARRALMTAVTRMAGGAPPAREAIGAAYRQASDEVARRYATLDYYLHAALFRDTFTRFTELLGIPFDEDAYAVYREAQHSDVVDGLSLKDDCHETLRTLRQRGLYLSIVSNIDEDMLQPLVQRERLHDWLHHWTSSEAAGSCKPHRRFFEVSLEKAGLAPEHVLFVGDSPEHDVNGAAALGMRTVLIRNGDSAPPLQSGAATVEPDFIIHRLSELTQLV
ncbi:MAG: HAD family hydrolase [Pseudomonadales bacterium]